MTRTIFTASALALVIAAGTGAMGYGMPGGGAATAASSEAPGCCTHST